MPEKKIEIKKIAITVGDKEIFLTPEEAEKLKNVLCELFGKEVIVKEKVIHEYRGWPIYWYQPAIQWDWNTIYCNSTTATTNPTLEFQGACSSLNITC